MAKQTKIDEDALFTRGIDIASRTVIAKPAEVGAAFYNRMSENLLYLARSSDPFTILFNNCGGSVIDGLAIYDLISSLTNHVTIKVYGEASSMGAIILQAADLRVMSPNAMLMLHDGHTSAPEMTLREFEERARESRRCRERMYRMLSARTGKPAKYYRNKLAVEWNLYADDALKEGLIDEIQ